MAEFGSLRAGAASQHSKGRPPSKSPAPPPDGALVVVIEQRQGAVVVRLRGSVAGKQAPALEAELQALAATRPGLVIVDLADLAMLPLPVMAALMSLRRELIRHNGRIVLAGLTTLQRRIFSAAELKAFFPTVASVELALARAKPRRKSSKRKS